MWEWQSLLQTSHLCVVSGRMELLLSFMRARLSAAAAISLSSPVLMCCFKPGVHTNDFATIHGRPVRIHTAPAEDNTSNQQSTPQALCEYERGDRES